jgi:hypothetical protein
MVNAGRYHSRLRPATNTGRLAVLENQLLQEWFFQDSLHAINDAN